MSYSETSSAVYNSSHFEIAHLHEIHAAIRACGLAQFVTSTVDGLCASPLPLFLDATEGEYGTLYGHLARANDQWNKASEHQALAIFVTTDAYISPTWYATKAITGKAVPTWNYETVHAYGTPEFFDDPQRLRNAVTRLTDLYEGKRQKPWQVTDAHADFIQSQLRGIVGIRMPIARLEGKRKMSQNRNEADRVGVVNGLCESGLESERLTAEKVRLKST